MSRLLTFPFQPPPARGRLAPPALFLVSSLVRLNTAPLPGSLVLRAAVSLRSDHGMSCATRPSLVSVAQHASTHWMKP